MLIFKGKTEAEEYASSKPERVLSEKLENVGVSDVLAATGRQGFRGRAHKVLLWPWTGIQGS